MTEDRIRELFREMRDEPVPADSRARVRLAVAERAARWPERWLRHWKIATAVLVPVCLLLIALLARQPAQVRVKPVSAPAAPSIAAVETPPVFAPPVAPPIRRRAAKAVRRVVAGRRKVLEDSATVIRLETNDPDIVILFVGS